MITRHPHDAPEPHGTFVSLDGEDYYRISSYDQMPSFLMSLAGDTDLWMFITSGGGLTAGRVDPEGSLFPYETVDKLHDAHHHTGPITLIRIRRQGGPGLLWQPFSEHAGESFHIERNLYKNTIGNRLVFEEINHDFDLAFRYRWSGCDAFGLVRTATLENRGSGEIAGSVLDGLRNVLPYGASLPLYQQFSSLVDAYKRTDIDPETRVGIFSLTSAIVDRAEAAEELRANTIWCHGLGEFEVCPSIEGVAAFRAGKQLDSGTTLTGRRGNYLTISSFELPPGARSQWHLAADTGRSHVQIAALRARLRDSGDLDAEIEAALLDSSENLLRNVGSADGFQLTGHPETTAHHFANVLFNNMRGGVFDNNYDLPAEDFTDFVRTRNRGVADRQESFLHVLPAEIRSTKLFAEAEKTGDTDFIRLCHEYLPIYFGRRHGDPSRPWNRFAIHVRNDDGTRALRYAGNWRDIFQNWEALAQSFPGFLPGIIAKFVNASTVDGFNPYRITRDGVDWEVVDPKDPWSYIGYWGDHQIIYLLKFLEALPRFSPRALEDMLELDIFCYADVPYRIKPYDAILEDPNATIVYDAERAERIAERVNTIGTDGKLLPGQDGSVYHVNLLEKLLVPALSKLSNLVPDGGIWMNTQRPEWNDANNALVGNGVSMVTLCHLRRYLSFLARLLDDREEATTSISTEVAAWFVEIRSILEDKRGLLDAGTLGDADRKQLLDALGTAFSMYRDMVYSAGFSGKTAIPVDEIISFCRVALAHVDHAIRANRRNDGLYHAYNILEIKNAGKEAVIHRLYEMLEGQVAVLSSGTVDAPEAVEVLDGLFQSQMYRTDQKSFLLYPERRLPGFLERNIIPEESVLTLPLLGKLLEAKDATILARDALGMYRFHGDFQNAQDLEAALDRLAKTDRWENLVAEDRQAVLDVFEQVFHHRSFTGRSGTMYGYEGLGCIYWHMVAKLLLSVQEIVLRAHREDASQETVDALMKHYYRIRSGLGFEKTVTEYGAFPTDPYSHTPGHAGAQQPGMTGQVKEEILTRFGELGVQTEHGMVGFRPVMLRPKEFLKEDGAYRYYDVAGTRHVITVPAGSLAFSFCQVPVVYTLTKNPAWIRITDGEGVASEYPGDSLDLDQSRDLFDRSGNITQIDVGVLETSLCRF